MDSTADNHASRLMTRRSLVIGLGVFGVVLVGALALHYRLALTSDRVVARTIQTQLTDVVGRDAVQRVLSARYQILAAGQGDWRSWFGKGQAGLPKAESFQVLVGRYRIVFEASVEALVVLDESGHVRDVLVRRSIDGL